MNDCLFCKIIRKELPAKMVFESETIVAFPDIYPSEDIHLLIVPKKHIDSVWNLVDKDSELLTQIYQVANKLVREYNLSGNLYRIVVNGGKAQHVPHTHFHLLGGKVKKMV